MPKFDTYFICTSPRSGSTHLCRLLSATNVAGKPESYFHTPSIERWADYFELKPHLFFNELEVIRSIFDAAITRGSCGSDVFGLRIQRPSFDYFMKQLTKLHPTQSNDIQRISATFQKVCFIHLTRLDKIQQAISLLKAEQTGLWHIAPDGSELERRSASQALIYDKSAIRKRISELTEYDRCWVDWFSREGIKPFRIEYEELSEKPAFTLTRLLGHLGIDTEAADGIEPEVAKMADQINLEWATRYRSESLE